MCGIVGLMGDFSKEEALRIVTRMNSVIIHRGPDDDGEWAADGIALGMRRLSIIDLAGGHQPMVNEDHSKQVVFNGEIYNFQDLRSRLMAQGHRFTTASDTEVILHQYEEDGPACVRHFNGMFAFAIWDQKTRTLLLARDRLGIKPLYYYWDGRIFLFASEIKALLASGLVDRQVNLQAMWDYLTFRYVPQPETIWQQVQKLPPAHTLTLSRDQFAPEIRRYWDIPYRDQGADHLDEQEVAAQFEKLFLNAVDLRLIADVPVGILLSGGLDSSAVAAAVAEVHDAQLSSFSVAFQDSPDTDELWYAKKVADFLGTEHHEIVIGERDFSDFLPRLVYFTDEPLADLASVPLYYVASLAREKVKVVLSGEGSDEILGGYRLDQTMQKWDYLRRFQRLPVWLRQGLGLKLAGLLGERWGKVIREANIPSEQFFRQRPVLMTNYLTSHQKQSLFQKMPPLSDSLELIQADLKRVQTGDFLHQLLYVWCQSWLVEDLLMKADKMTMANSIELRVPFLDYRLVEWAAQTPPWVKVGRRNGQGRYETKRVLRRFAASRLPAEIISRPKQGFPVPVYGWLSKGLKPWAQEMLATPDTLLYRWLKPAEVQRQLALGIRPDGLWLDQHRLWNLLILEVWAREWQPQ